ncbi:Ndr family protein [Streptomyces nigrescens]|uniref:Ndr family protein n=1 Tax=Streptomyces nigrescens TaxID=1920 RepID=A0ABM7ZVF4_STRNI|nr:alpha/beta fold hydrolase [Streptomyces nigrescens]BDM70300.1 Ndr family protein [Streptomyces nigrescens]
MSASTNAPTSTSTIYKTEAGAREIQQRYREMLQDWPVPAEEVRIPTREGETFVLASGPKDAPPVLLLHGSGANTTMWLDDIASWSQHFRTYALDLIGEPGLSAPSRPPLSSDAHALWLDEVLEYLGVSRTAIVATSLGGWVALDYATRRPDRVTRLALLCPGGVGRQKVAWLFKAVLLRAVGRRGVRRSTAAVTGLSAPETQHLLDHVMLTFTHFKPRTERLPLFPDSALRRLTMPTLVTVGSRDAMFDSEGTVRRVRQCLPHATVNVLPEAGHALLNQTDSVLTFLRG